jgi:hypothetical protein
MPGLWAAMPAFAEARARPPFARQRVALGGQALRRQAAAAAEVDGSLAAFVGSVADGQAGVVRGVYAAGALALAVVQQPSGAPFYVDMQPGIQMYIAVTVSDNKMVIDAYDTNNILRDSVALAK